MFSYAIILCRLDLNLKKYIIIMEEIYLREQNHVIY